MVRVLACYASAWTVFILVKEMDPNPPTMTTLTSFRGQRRDQE